MNTRTEPGGARPETRESEGRRERGIGAYAEIFDVPEADVPAAFSARVGLPFAEEQLQAAGGLAWSHPALTGRLRQARRHRLDEDALTAPDDTPGRLPRISPSLPRDGSRPRPVRHHLRSHGAARAAVI